MQTWGDVPPSGLGAHTATDSNKHHVGTDLEAPVVWLLLRGEKEKETKGGEKKRTSETFSLQLSCETRRTGGSEAGTPRELMFLPDETVAS